MQQGISGTSGTGRHIQMSMAFHLKGNQAAVPYIKYIAALLLFRSNGIVASRIHLESSQIILLRTMLGSLLLAAVAAAGKRACSGIMSRRDFMYVALSGVSMGVSWMFQYEAYQLVGISITSLLYCLGPILIVVLAQLFLGERMTFLRALCLIAVSAGAVLTGGFSLTHGADARGIACALLCAIAYAGMIMFSKKNRSIMGIRNSAIQLTFGFLTALAYCSVKWLSGSAWEIVPPDGDWIPVLILGLVNTGFGCYLYFSGIPEIPAQTVAVCDYIEPLSAVVLAALVLGEKLTLMQYAGGVLIMAGIIVWNLFPAARRASVLTGPASA